MTGGVGAGGSIPPATRFALLLRSCDKRIPIGMFNPIQVQVYIKPRPVKVRLLEQLDLKYLIQRRSPKPWKSVEVQKVLVISQPMTPDWARIPVSADPMGSMGCLRRGLRSASCGGEQS